MSHPPPRRHSHQFDDPEGDEGAAPHRGPGHPHHVPSMPPPGAAGGRHPPHHPHPHHHPRHMMPPPHPHHAPPPPGPGPGGFFHHPSAFNSGLAAAIAAAEYQKQRQRETMNNIFAAAHANGVGQPYIPGFPPPHHGRMGPPLPPPGQQGQATSPTQEGRTSPPAKTSPREEASKGNDSPSSHASPEAASGSASSKGNANAPAPSESGGNIPIPPRLPIFSNGRPELPPPRWYDSRVPLGVLEDKYYLSELQCVLRSEFVEAFGTTQMDIVLPVHGRNKPIALGQVGIRCQHCRDHSTVVPTPDKGDKAAQNAITYPSFISGIYNTVQQMYRLHFDACPHIPDELKARVKTLKDSHTSNRGGRKQYWQDSARRIGLVDTSFGIHFGRDPHGPLPSFGGRHGSFTLGTDEDDIHAQWALERGYGHGAAPFLDGYGGMDDDALEGQLSAAAMIPVEEVEIYPLVLPEDRNLISDYLYLALEQMQPCNLMDADRVGCYKARRTGFPGLACRHCIGQAGCGRYFPASEASLSQTTTSQTIVNHVRNCRRTPLEIREQLELMKRAKTCPDYKKGDKPKHGGRKVFFHRLWCRIQRIPLPKFEKSHSPEKDDESQDGHSPTPAGSPGKEKKRRKSADLLDEGGGSRRKKSKDDSLYDLDGGDLRGDFSETVEFDNVHPDAERALSSSARIPATATTIMDSHVLYQGRCRLTRGDDPHWLSEADCFIRRELVEAFTAQEEDLDMFGDPEIGQVGVRCFYCAETKAPHERTRCHVYFPSSVGAVQQAVSDLQRRHLQLCKAIPEDVRDSFRSMKGYGSKPKGDTTQYWIDAARELGLHDSHEGQGISFFRNPLDNSPSDELDIERNSGAPTGTALVPAEDRDKCTDSMMLLFKQFEPCQFRTNDRKSSRSRDRPIGFPGLICIHCEQKRYFPITEKRLQDSLSLMNTHIQNCFHAPLDVKASLCYLQHRSLLQKQELSAQWKFAFLKGVFGRLHPEHHGTDSSLATDPDASPSANDTSSAVDKAEALPKAASPAKELSAMEALEEVADAYVPEEQPAYYENEEAPVLDHTDALREMQPLIKAAALWLCERDAEYEAQARGRGRGFKRR